MPAAATDRVRAQWRWAVPPCTGPSGASWKAIWNGRCARIRVLGRGASSPARKKTCWGEGLARPPEGRARWTLELLADAMVKLTGHESLSGETVRRRLAENGLKPWRRDMWCIPRVDGEYVARMEDVLDLYAEAPDPKRP